MRSTRVSYLGGLVLFMLGPLASSGCGFLFLDSVDGGIDAAAATEDAPSPDAPGLDAPRTDAPPISVEGGTPPGDAFSSGECFDPRAVATPSGCVLATPAPCTPFDPCPTDYACVSTASGDRCRCVEQARCGPRCTGDPECTTPGYPVCHGGVCFAPHGCLGRTSEALLCGAGRVCNTMRHECEAAPTVGLSPLDALCTNSSECSTALCAHGRCRMPCASNAECGADHCVRHAGPETATYCDAVLSCAACTDSSSVCDEESGWACIVPCVTSAECAGTDCRIQNGTTLEPFCGTTTACGAAEVRIDVDGGRAQACATWTTCFDSADCPASYACLEAAYGGLGLTVGLCGWLP
jgi:hypothetical protein